MNKRLHVHLARTSYTHSFTGFIYLHMPLISRQLCRLVTSCVSMTQSPINNSFHAQPHNTYPQSASISAVCLSIANIGTHALVVDKGRHARERDLVGNN